MPNRFMLAVVAAAASGLALAQAPPPAPPKSPETARPPREARPRAPRETVAATLDGRKVSIEYGRPELGGRTIDALLSKLAADRIWRAGVDQVTTLTSEADLMVGDTRVAAGKYSLYVYAPETGPFALVLNRDLGVPLKSIFAQASPEMANEPWPRLGGAYGQVKDQEVARVTMTAVTPREPMERFLISLEPAKDGASAITVTWDARSWSVPIRSAGKPAAR
jgi:hypothetical protein